MKKLALIGLTVMGAVILSASPISLRWSAETLSVSQDEAYAVVGRPATPGSVAGVARRTTRRAYRHHYYYPPLLGIGSATVDLILPLRSTNLRLSEGSSSCLPRAPQQRAF
jgi:hypothetical protein